MSPNAYGIAILLTCRFVVWERARSSGAAGRTLRRLAPVTLDGLYAAEETQTEFRVVDHNDIDPLQGPTPSSAGRGDGFNALNAQHAAIRGAFAPWGLTR